MFDNFFSLVQLPIYDLHFIFESKKGKPVEMTNIYSIGNNIQTYLAGNFLKVFSSLEARSCSLVKSVSQSSATKRMSLFSPYTKPVLTAF